MVTKNQFMRRAHRAVMCKFCIRQWRLIALLIVAAIWIIVFPVWSNWVTKSPLDAELSLFPPGSIREEIEIRIPERYRMELKFERDGTEFNQLKKVIGASNICLPGEECSTGVPVPVRWSLTNSESGAVVSSGLVETANANGWSRAHVSRFVDLVQVHPGKYIFEADVTRPVPELADIRTRIVIELQPKGSTTWQVGAVWWGSMGYIFWAWPAGVYALVLLLWRAARWYRSG